MLKEFQRIRCEFGTFFNVVREYISKSCQVEELKTCVIDCFQDTKFQLVEAKTCEDVLNVVREKCSLIDITGVEALVKRFNIVKAHDVIEEYKLKIEEFCKDVSENPSLKKNLDDINSCDRNTYEAAVFLLDWSADESMQEDIKAILSHSLSILSKNIQVSVRNKSDEEQS